MFRFILLLLKIILLPLSKVKQEILFQLLTVKKENAILLRSLEVKKKRIRFSWKEKFFFALLIKFCSRLKSAITIVKPETVLKWYHNFMKNRWTFPAKNRGGRPQTPAETKELILRLKNENVTWGNKKIQGELLKLGIELDKNTIARIIRDFRKHGKIKTSGSWKKFIKSHLDSLFAMDFLTIDTLFSGRLYLFFIIRLKTREIVQFRLTDSPSKRFVTQQLLGWREEKEKLKVYLIHDNDQAFSAVDYEACKIVSMPTCPYAPNMNAFAERFVRTIRNEALDHFILFNFNQVENISEEFIIYYNTKRPHQGIEQQTPKGYTPQKEGKIVSSPVLSGLHHYYERKAS